MTFEKYGGEAKEKGNASYLSEEAERLLDDISSGENLDIGIELEPNLMHKAEMLLRDEYPEEETEISHNNEDFESHELTGREKIGTLYPQYQRLLDSGEYSSVDEMCNDLLLSDYDVYWTPDDFDDEEEL